MRVGIAPGPGAEEQQQIEAPLPASRIRQLLDGLI